MSTKNYYLLVGFLFLIAGVSLLLVTGCNNTPSEPISHQNIDADGTRGVKTLDFQGSQVSLNLNTDVVTLAAKTKAAANDDAANTLKGIKGRLTTAENIKQVLDVKFHMEDTPVEDGLFVFGVESVDAKKLTLEMYDEEGYSMAANNTVQINSGNNYKAVKVDGLESGTYIFKLKDETGKELTRQVKIAHK